MNRAGGSSSSLYSHVSTKHEDPGIVDLTLEDDDHVGSSQCFNPSCASKDRLLGEMNFDLAEKEESL